MFPNEVFVHILQYIPAYHYDMFISTFPHMATYIINNPKYIRYKFSNMYKKLNWDQKKQFIEELDTHDYTYTYRIKR